MTTVIRSENAPVTTAGTVINATNVPGSVNVPITVKNFVSIGSFTLTLRYQANLVSYVNATPHPSFPGISVSGSVEGNTGKITITWPRTPGGVTLPDETHLVDLNFTWLSGSSVLTWLDNGDDSCQYTGYNGGAYIQLTDTPKSTYFINGAISNRGAPVTYAPVIDNPVPGSISVPVLVNNFTSIGAMSLTLEYDQAVLNFQSCTPNPGLSGTFNAGTQMGPNGKMIVTISWFGLTSLDNGSTLATIHFIYSDAVGSYSGLNWFETGSSCEYADAMANALPDFPAADYYKNGAVYTQVAPKVWLPVITNATPSGPISLPVSVKDFTDISSFTLTFEYDPAVMTYVGFEPAPDLGSALTVADSPSGAKRKIVMSWSGTSSGTLPDGSTLTNLIFTSITGTSPLIWIVTDAASCRFNDAAGHALYDLPKSTCYQDGLFASHTAPLTAAGNVAATAEQFVTVPLNVFHFSNIGLFSLALDYDPAILTFQGASLIPSIGGSFSASAAGQGRIVMEWSGTAASLADGSNLISLLFACNGGATTLAWYDDGNSCRYAESPAGPSLYDTPRSDYYINGYAGPDPLVAGFIAGGSGSGADTTILLTDQSTGGPTSWKWTISPSTCYFVNGTTASSQNPQLRFTADGLYTVTLIATRGTGSAMIIKTGYLDIRTASNWTGITSSDWFDGSNWQNMSVPVASAEVVIPAFAPNWPHLTGDLILGTLCKKITLEGAARLSVDGNLMITSGSTLTFTGSGTLFLGGNWSDSGVFDPGTGTVEFNGPDDATIFGGASAETFWEIVLAKTNATVFVIGVINVTGTETVK